MVDRCRSAPCGWAAEQETQAREDFRNGVRVLRIQQRERNERNAFTYLWRMLTFLLRSSWVLARRSMGRRDDVVHMHSVPDFEVFAAIGARLRGAGVILDIHDISPEFYASKFDIGTDHLIVRFLAWIERWSCRFADHVIISNDLWRERLLARSVSAERSSVVLNHVDWRFLEPHPRPPENGRFRITYPGGLQWHQGVDLAIEAFAKVYRDIPGAEFRIYGEGSEKPRLTELIRERGLGERVKIMDPVPFAAIPALLAETDLGVVAKRADSFGNEAYSTKILEYMSQGVPVLCARTAIDQYYFPEHTVRFFSSGSVDELAEAMRDVALHPEERARLAEAGRAHVARNNWEIHKQTYIDLVDRLANQRRLGKKTN